MPNYISTGFKELTQNRQFFFHKILSYFFYIFKKTSNLPRPLNYQIEPSKNCNLSCQMCAVKNDHSLYPNLSVKNFHRLLNHIQPLQSVNLSGLGEPLLNSNLEYFFKKLSRQKIYTFTITNAQLLNRNKIYRLRQSGLKSIIVSLESSNPKEYQHIRTGAKFKILERHLGFIKNKPRLILNTLLLSPNITNTKHLYQLIDFAQKHQASHLNFFVADNVLETGTLDYFRKNSAKIKTAYKQIYAYAQKKSIKINLPSLSFSSGSCTSPWLFPYVSVSGDVFPCCAILHLALANGIDRKTAIKRYSFGNVFNTPVDQIWNSPKAITFRQSFANKKYDQHCLLCSKFYGFK